jgi:hypothetical protein
MRVIHFILSNKGPISGREVVAAMALLSLGEDTFA